MVKITDNTAAYLNNLDKKMPGLLAVQAKKAVQLAKLAAPVAGVKYKDIKENYINKIKQRERRENKSPKPAKSSNSAKPTRERPATSPVVGGGVKSKSRRIGRGVFLKSNDRYEHSGQLRANIYSNVDSTDENWRMALFVQDSAIGLTGYYGRTPTLFKGRVHYAIYNEFGTRRMAARPFMTPAIEGVLKPLMDSIKNHLGTGGI